MKEIYAAIAAAAVDVDAPRYPKGQAGVLLMTAIGNLAGASYGYVSAHWDDPELQAAIYAERLRRQRARNQRKGGAASGME